MDNEAQTTSEAEIIELHRREEIADVTFKAPVAGSKFGNISRSRSGPAKSVLEQLKEQVKAELSGSVSDRPRLIARAIILEVLEQFRCFPVPDDIEISLIWAEEILNDAWGDCSQFDVAAKYKTLKVLDQIKRS